MLPPVRSPPLPLLHSTDRLKDLSSPPMSLVEKPKRILMLLENESVPDDNRVLLEALTLGENGYRVTVICPTGHSKKWFEIVDGIRIYRYPKTFELDGFLGYVWEYGYSLVMMFAISLYVWVRHGFDVVHVHTPPDLTALIAIFYQGLGKKFVFDHHDLSPELYLARRDNPSPNRVYRALCFFERLACRRADRLIATNASQRNIQITRGGAQAEHCFIVRNGPNELFLNSVEPHSHLRQAGKLVIGYVGAIGIQDDVDTMIRVVHELKHRHGRQDFMAVIVGDGPAVPGLKKLIRELGVDDRLQFTGMLPFPDVPRYIASFDICLTPDHSNPYNDSCTTIKTMEYMALRKPTVCFETHENKLTAGEAALYAADNDLPAFTRAVVRLMDDPALRATMGETGRRRIDEGLTWDHQAVRLLALYDHLYRAAPHDLVNPQLPDTKEPNVDPAVQQIAKT